MPLSSIVTIVLRLFAIRWIVQGVVSLCSVAREFFNSWGPMSYSHFYVPLSYIVVALLLFMWSHVVARVVTPRTNSEVTLGTLTQYDLYCFAFTFLGLYSALNSFADTLNWIHYFVVGAREPIERNALSARNFYEFTHQLVTLLAGGAFLLFAPRCARKLTALQKRQEQGTRTTEP